MKPQHSRLPYGWIVIAASFILLFGSFGTQLCFTIFFKPLTEEFGWTRAAVSGAMSLLLGVWGLVGIVMGRLTDKYGARVVIAVGMLIGAASYVLLSTIDSLWELYLYFGLGAGIYLGSTYTPVTATVSRWFDEKRTFALGTALMGIAVGQMVLSPIIAEVVTARGWRTSYVVLGIVAFVCAIPALVVMGRTPAVAAGPGSGAGAPAQPSLHLHGFSLKEAARTAPFWMLVATGFVLSAGFYMVAAHIVPYATDFAVSTRVAALILTVSSLASVVGTLVAWPIAVKLSSKRALLVLILGEALAIFLFIFTRSAWAFYVVALIFGLSFGAASPVRMGMATPLFGLKAIGTILGYATLAFSVGGIIGPLLAGYVFDLRGSYDVAFVVAVVLLIGGALSAHFFGSHKRTEEAYGPER